MIYNQARILAVDREGKCFKNFDLVCKKSRSFLSTLQDCSLTEIFFTTFLGSIKMSNTVAINKEKRYLTTGSDIQNALSRCKQCYTMTNDGNYVLFHTELPNITISRKKKKLAFIINTEENSNSLGHWFALLTYSGKVAVLADSLCIVEKEKPRVMENIKLFCDRNHLSFMSLSHQIQQKHSLKCGFLALHWVARASKLTLRTLLSYKRVLMKHSVRTNEKIALNFAKKHFKLDNL